MSTKNLIKSPIEFYVSFYFFSNKSNLVLNLHQTVKYLDKIVFIQSILRKHYILISMSDSNTFQIPISMSPTKKKFI
jgi:hypothetical protein